MCGIFTLLKLKSNLDSKELALIYQAFLASKSRGPDMSSFDLNADRLCLGFHRLAINELSALANQPFQFAQDDKTFFNLTNGEIYAHDALRKEYDLKTRSHGDCEIIVPLFQKVGLQKTASLLGSEFASVIVEIQNGQFILHVMRDPIGVRPLFYAFDGTSIAISSEIKSLTPLFQKVSVFPPGHTMVFNSADPRIEFQAYHTFLYKQIPDISIETAQAKIRNLFIEAVQRRLMTDRPYGCLLPGGLDSSLVVGVAKSLKPQDNFPVFTIAFKSGGTDLPYAIKVAKYLGLTNHHIIEIDEMDALKEIDETIFATESYDITTIRASTMQRIVGKYIQEKTSVKVLLCGENSDEMFCGYKYFHCAPDESQLYTDAVRLVTDVHRFDGLRTDRTMAHHGLEVRLPFADYQLVDYVFSLPPSFIAPKEKVEKKLLRDAFKGLQLIPDDVLYRSKEALSDGCSSLKKSWFQIIQEHIDTIVSDKEFEENKSKFTHLPPPTKEAYYYRKKFTEYFGNSEEVATVIPYYWMPKWVGSSVTDPSARTLSVYADEATEQK